LCCIFKTLRTPISTLFPYTTLFRSQLVHRPRGELLLEVHRAVARELVHETGELGRNEYPQVLVLGLGGHFAWGDYAHSSTSGSRSEEHTSELQSRSDLVCRLLLEKN